MVKSRSLYESLRDPEGRAAVAPFPGGFVKVKGGGAMSGLGKGKGGSPRALGWDWLGERLLWDNLLNLKNWK